MIAVDTNVLIRFLIAPSDRQNPAWQTEEATKLIRASDEVFLSDVVLAEAEWVLEEVFELKRLNIHHLLYQLASNNKFCFEDWSSVHLALMDYREHKKVEFSDCLIARRANSAGAETLYTFESDKKLGALPLATSLTSKS